MWSPLHFNVVAQTCDIDANGFQRATCLSKDLILTWENSSRNTSRLEAMLIGHKHIYEGYKRFKDGRISVDDPRSERQLNSLKPQNVAVIRNAILEDRPPYLQHRGTCRMRRLRGIRPRNWTRHDFCKIGAAGAFIIQGFLTKHKLTDVPPDLTPRGCFLFLRMKINLIGPRFYTGH